MFIGIFILNSLLPFIWFEKLNETAIKYMFIIEKYGYLTDEEQDNLIEDLKQKGFKEENIEIAAPKEIKNYGELIEFRLQYKLEKMVPVFNNNIFGNKTEEVIITVNKNSFSKR